MHHHHDHHTLLYTIGREAQNAALSLGGVRTKKDLPHGKQCRDLFEVSIPERKFVRNERNLNLFLCDAQVEGVYESQVPLSLRGNNDVVFIFSKC